MVTEALKQEARFDIHCIKRVISTRTHHIYNIDAVE